VESVLTYSPASATVGKGPERPFRRHGQAVAGSIGRSNVYDGLVSYRDPAAGQGLFVFIVIAVLVVVAAAFLGNIVMLIQGKTSETVGISLGIFVLLVVGWTEYQRRSKH
jgi:hypothetical protein